MVGTIFKYLSSTNLSVRLFFGQRLLVRCVKNIHASIILFVLSTYYRRQRRPIKLIKIN